MAKRQRKSDENFIEKAKKSISLAKYQMSVNVSKAKSETDGSVLNSVDRVAENG